VHLIHYRNSLNLPVLLAELFAWVVLGLSYRDFKRIPDKMTVIKALAFVSASVVLVLLNATLGIFMLKEHFTNIKDICDALVNSVKLLIFMDTGFLSISGRIGHIYADSLISINWICIIASAVLVLKPLVYDYIENILDKEKVQRLVSCFGQNPIAYLALENDKRYLFGKNIDGVCPYQVVGNVFVVCGDMICDKKDGFLFLNEILSFCNQNGYKIIFLNITDAFLELYKMAGFGLLKYGEDACFRLADYNLAGGRVAKVRAAINHANKAGITVMEYKPLVLRNPAVENQISDITKEWLSNKGGVEMGFMLGGTGLENPLSRRYFYAEDNEGKMLGFVVFLPYLSGKGYLADVTRRRSDAPQGVLEKITYDAFMQMKDEGVVWGNMGLSPLYNVAANDKAAITEKLFNYIYKNMNNSYGFKALHHAKEKYAPTEWQPRYLAYSPRPFSPNLAYAIVRVQLGKKLPQVVLKELGRKRDSNEK
jgi:phosphatidylglycerol lysyltransferase